MLIWRRAIELASSRYRSDEATLLFHYTTKGNFNAVCSSAYLTPELWSALKDADGSVRGLSEEPDQLEAKVMEAQESNKTSNSEEVRATSSGLPSDRSKFCLAIKVPKEMVQKVLTNPNDSPHQIWKIVCPEEAAWLGEYRGVRDRYARERCMKLAASKSEQRLLRILEDERQFCNVEIGHLPVLDFAPLEARKAALGTEHPETLIASNELAALIVAQGRFADAEPLYRSTLLCLQARLGPEDPDTLRTACNLAALLAALGHTTEAESLGSCTDGVPRALKPTWGPNIWTPCTTADVEWYCQSKLAQVLKTRGYAQEAEQLLQRVVRGTRGPHRGMKEKLGAQHPDTLCNCAALASVMEVLGRAQEAEPVQIKALEGFKAKLGETHPDTVESAMGLASIYSARGKHEMAEPLLQQVLEWRERKLGHLHPDTLTTLERSAETSMVLGRLKQAEQYHLKIIQLRQSSLGPDHLETLQAMSNLAYMYKMLGQLDKAEPLYRRVLTSHETHLGPSHNVTAASMANLAGLLKEKGRHGEAEVLYRRALESREARHGRRLGEAGCAPKAGLHHDTLQSVNDLAGLLRLKGQFDEALHGEDHVEIYRATAATDQTIRVKNNHALLLKDRDDKSRFDHQKAKLKKLKLGQSTGRVFWTAAGPAGPAQAEQLYREARAGGSAKLGGALLGPSSDEAQQLFLHVVAGSRLASLGAF
ncbi:unnamed protein product [Cladocopium goreaui]|uniref:Nephrocystin-3 n=1 Tax=Cladocopium goreaui TaxID=2562237 RepID=A0A9P1C226_9DINO|nr:unnamed protein product [Cladocopium goreaui]